MLPAESSEELVCQHVDESWRKPCLQHESFVCSVRDLHDIFSLSDILCQVCIMRAVLSRKLRNPRRLASRQAIKNYICLPKHLYKSVICPVFWYFNSFNQALPIRPIAYPSCCGFRCLTVCISYIDVSSP